MSRFGLGLSACENVQNNQTRSKTNIVMNEPGMNNEFSPFCTVLYIVHFLVINIAMFSFSVFSFNWLCLIEEDLYADFEEDVEQVRKQQVSSSIYPAYT